MPANLSDVNVTTLEAQPQLSHLGFALGIDETSIVMLSLWLHICSSQRPWERLVTTLKQPTVVVFNNLTRSIEEQFGMKVKPVFKKASIITAATATTDSDAGQCYYGFNITCFMSYVW
jgi:hypothetical protein